MKLSLFLCSREVEDAFPRVLTTKSGIQLVLPLSHRVGKVKISIICFTVILNTNLHLASFNQALLHSLLNFLVC